MTITDPGAESSQKGISAIICWVEWPAGSQKNVSATLAVCWLNGMGSVELSNQPRL